MFRTKSIWPILIQLLDLEKEYLNQRTELIEANTQALRELQKQEFIIKSYIPDEYFVCATFLLHWNETKWHFSESYSRECKLEWKIRRMESAIDCLHWKQYEKQGKNQETRRKTYKTFPLNIF